MLSLVALSTFVGDIDKSGFLEIIDKTGNLEIIRLLLGEISHTERKVHQKE